MIKKQQSFTSLAKAYGYFEIESTNKNMWSWRCDDNHFRINYYFTNGTVTIQGPTISCLTYKNVQTENAFEDVLETIKKIYI
jgi:hypothetical protein